MPAKPKCPCGCGQAPAETTRLRKASCSCGASIIRLSRSALLTVNASCISCGDPLEPDCLLDRAARGDETAIGILETRHDDTVKRHGHKMPGRRANMFRCGDCSAIRSADPAKPCKACGSTHAPDTSYMHPRASRAVGAMPF